MNRLIRKIKQLQKSQIKKIIDQRIKEFEELRRKDTKQWFSELCFCLLTANWKAKESIQIQKELCYEGFCQMKENDLQKFLQKKGHRFHPQRAERIVIARKYINIKEILKGMNEYEAREWLVKNVKGLGYKESSHFLRNVGYKNLAIIDRHILNLMVDEKIIKQKPNTLTKKKYLEIEKKFLDIARELKMSAAELDLYMWYMKTGKVLK